MNRRKFLKLMATWGCGAAVHRSMFGGEMLAFGAPVAGKKTLIVVNFAGGMSYNAAPLYHGAYYTQNPTISYDPSNSLQLTAQQGLHPALTEFKSLYDQGDLALLNLVGYPDPNRSHDESTRIWMSGIKQQMSAASGGWAARLGCKMSSSFGGISLAGSNLLINGGCGSTMALNNLNQLGQTPFKYNDQLQEWLGISRDTAISAADSTGESYDLVEGATTDYDRSARTIQTATSAAPPIDTFSNTGFGQQCRDAARLIQAQSVLGTQLIYMERGGFDTHAGERVALNNNLTDVNNGLTALVANIKAMGAWDDTVIVTMSEFSRTFENNSFGTDHGHAAPMFVAGGQVRGGILTPPPTDADTNRGPFYSNIHVDFREVFELATNHIGYQGIFPERITKTGLRLF